MRGIELAVHEGELHAVMGPNGSGKSTFASLLAGSPAYEVTAGGVRLRSEDVTGWAPDVPAKAGIFLAFQHPEEIPGVPVSQFLRQAAAERRGAQVCVLETRVQLREWLDRLGMDPAFAKRHLNEGFSGGEKKRSEIPQMAVLSPEIALLDETDPGLDVDSPRVVAQGVDEVRRTRPELGVVVVTHCRKILDELSPDRVDALVDGGIVGPGGPELAADLEREGYEPWRH